VVEVFGPNFPVTVEVFNATTNAIESSLTITEPDTLSFENLAPGPYRVAISDAEGCSNSTLFFVTEFNGLDVTISQQGNSCFGEEGITLTAQASGSDGVEYEYQWSNGATTQSISNVIGGDFYSVVVLDPINGCEGEAGVDVFNQGDDSLSFFQGTFFIPCAVDSVLVTPDTILEGFSYTWFGQQNDVIEGATFFATEAGFYNLRATNDNDCIITGSARVINNDLTNDCQRMRHRSAQLFRGRLPGLQQYFGYVVDRPGGGL